MATTIPSISPNTRYPARHKKTNGTLALTDTALAFIPQNHLTTTTNGVKSNGNGKAASNIAPLNIPWTSIQKHQVSPLTYPKHLLKIICFPGVVGHATALTFELNNRADLERIRKDATYRLSLQKSSSSSTGKRKLDQLSTPTAPSTPPPPPFSSPSRPPTTFTTLSPTTLAVTRSSILAADPTLRQQHDLLTQNGTLTEDDFWHAHNTRLADEAAKIHGTYRPGMGSHMRSNLDLGLRGTIKLGVEEMRQIFILYPAVHKAYEEKVPLELSEEQFWRKYLESEYFHRDRGRIGMSARKNLNHSNANKPDGTKDDNDKNKDKITDDQEDEADRRAAVAGTDDIFSRYDGELRAQAAAIKTNNAAQRRDTGERWKKRPQGKNMAVGQFDLASTVMTERDTLRRRRRGMGDDGDVVGGGTTEDDSFGTKIVQKYNRHWAMVLNPDDATAGSHLLEVARGSIDHAIQGDFVAKVGGGVREEMERLVAFADCDEETADHVNGDKADFITLELTNEEAYRASHTAPSSNTGQGGSNSRNNYLRQQQSLKSSHAAAANNNQLTSEEQKKRMLTLITHMTSKADHDFRPSLPTEKTFNGTFPDKGWGVKILKALTKKMAEAGRTDTDALKITNSLTESFKTKLNSFFRRSSELLRHFFGLRRLMEGGDGHEKDRQKLLRIVKGMEGVYREMETMRRELPQTMEGEVMRKMCLPIMDQLDWAFKLHRDGTGGGGGGFVTVEKL